MSRRGGRAGAVAAGVVVLGATLSWLPSSPATAAGCSSFEAIAAADAVRGELFQPGELIAEQADSEGPAAQSVVNSLGESRGYAGAPYPGDVGLAGLGLAGDAATGGAVGPDSYPLAVTSQYPADARNEDTSKPGITLIANSAALRTTTRAQVGAASGEDAAVGSSRADADAQCAETDGTITAVADSDSQSLSFGAGVLRIGRVHSTARAVLGPDGTPQLSSQLDVGEVTVAGQTVKFTEAGLNAAGNEAPLPDNPVTAALEQAGLSVTYLAPIRTSNSILAAGIRVRSEQALGLGTGNAVVTITFGRAFALVGGEPSTGGTTTGGATGATATGGSTTTTGSPPGTTTTGDSGPPVLQPDGSGATTGDTGVVPPPDTAPGAGATTGSTPAAFRQPSYETDGLYLALVIGATALFMGGFLLRVIGVKLGWT